MASELLKQLKIDRTRDGTRRRGRWAALALVLLAVAVGTGWYALGRAARPVVRTAVARPAADADGAASVLDASGYVTARRQATVSAKITGRVVEVLIEEGLAGRLRLPGHARAARAGPRLVGAHRRRRGLAAGDPGRPPAGHRRPADAVADLTAACLRTPSAPGAPRRARRSRGWSASTCGPTRARPG